MKQAITKEQWDELNIEESAKLVEFFGGTMSSDYPMTIGRMIEYIGDDLNVIRGKDNVNTKWTVENIIGRGHDFDAKELIDALWESAKYKLGVAK